MLNYELFSQWFVGYELCIDGGTKCTYMCGFHNEHKVTQMNLTSYSKPQSHRCKAHQFIEVTLRIRSHTLFDEFVKDLYKPLCLDCKLT